MHISEWQRIFHSGNAYFRVAMPILAWLYIFRSGSTYFGVARHISERHSFISAPYLQIVAS